MAILQENALKMKAKLNIAVKSSNLAKHRLKFARQVTEERLKECLPVQDFEAEHSKVLITLMSSLLDEDNFDIDPDTDSLKPKEDFLKDVRDSFDKHANEVVIKERLEFVKNQLVEKVKDKAARNRSRKSSFSSTCSQSMKRTYSMELLNQKEAVRSKTSPTSIMN